MLARLSALFLLAFALVKTLLQRWGNGSSLRRFAEQYGAEGIHSVSRRDARILAEVHRCTACGRCDEGEGERVANARNGYRGMMALALAGARSLPDFNAVAASLEGIPDSAFSFAETRCPERVPLLELGRLVRRSGSSSVGVAEPAGQLTS